MNFINYKLIFTIIFSSLLLILSSCGGGGTQVSDGGIGGTGITVGRISGFGSLIVNGVKFDVSTSSFTRDGLNSSGQPDFSIGEIVTIVGKVNDDGVTGTANSVSFVNDVEGPVTLLVSGTQLEVLGQVVHSDGDTVFHGFNSIAELQEGDNLEISGFVDTEGVIQASSIKLLNESQELEVKGVISNLNKLNQSLSINNLLVDYSNAEFENLSSNQLENGLFIEVDGERFENGILLAKKLELEDEAAIKTGTELEIEGLITRFISALEFDVNGQAVLTNIQTEFKNGTPDSLALNVKVEVKGLVNAEGVLVAEEVDIEPALASIPENEPETENEPESDNQLR